MHPRREAVVDILVAAWNRSDTIERAITSALGEAEVRQVIVIDDASTDDTFARAAQIGAGSERVVVRRLPSNLGPAAARNRGLEISTAPYVAILDGDDFFQPGRMGKLLAHAGDFDFVADDILEVSATGALRPMMFERRIQALAARFRNLRRRKQRASRPKPNRARLFQAAHATGFPRPAQAPL